MSNKSKKQQGNKKKRLNIRLTEDELKIVKKKSERYPSVSALIIDAVENHDVRRGRNRIDTMIKFAELMEKSEISIIRIGTNINQIAKEINRQRIEGVNLGDAFTAQFCQGIEEAVAILGELLMGIRNLSR